MSTPKLTFTVGYISSFYFEDAYLFYQFTEFAS